MLKDTLKSKTMAAMKAKDSVAVTIYRLAQGEVQQNEARAGRDFTDADVQAVLKKLVKSNEETIVATADGEAKEVLVRETALLKELLPAAWGVPQIVEALASVKDAIVGAGNDGQATGVAMKHLKSLGAQVTGADVGAAVKQLRGVG